MVRFGSVWYGTMSKSRRSTIVIRFSLGKSDPFAISSEVAMVQWQLAQVCNDPNLKLSSGHGLFFRARSLDPFDVPMPKEDRRRG